MSYTVTVSMLFDSAETAVKHTSAASSIISSLAYVELDQHEEKTTACNKLLRDLQAEADRRKPAETGGLTGKLSTAAADYKSMITNVSRYFATSAGHIYRRAVKSAMQQAANAIAAGAASAPETEKDAIQFVASFVKPINVPFIGVKKNQFRAEWESLRARFVRLSEGAYERRQKADSAAVQLAELRRLLAENGIELEELATA